MHHKVLHYPGTLLLQLILWNAKKMSVHLSPKFIRPFKHINHFEIDVRKTKGRSLVVFGFVDQYPFRRYSRFFKKI